MSVNKVILVGNCGKNAEVRTVGDRKVASFTLATSERRKGADGNYLESTEWHNIVIWGNGAETAEKYVQKGTQLYVEGKIKYEKYTGSDGVEKYATRIYASNFQLLGGKPESQPTQPAKVQYKTTPIVAGEPDESDLPF